MVVRTAKLEKAGFTAKLFKTHILKTHNSLGYHTNSRTKTLQNSRRNSILFFFFFTSNSYLIVFN